MDVLLFDKKHLGVGTQCSGNLDDSYISPTVFVCENIQEAVWV